MSMSTYVVGFRPPDEKWRKMKAVWDACITADIPFPEGLEEFFGWSEPDERGIKISLENVAVKWSGEMRQGYEIELDKIPQNITVIRFVNSW